MSTTYRFEGYISIDILEAAKKEVPDSGYARLKVTQC